MPDALSYSGLYVHKISSTPRYLVMLFLIPPLLFWAAGLVVYPQAFMSDDTVIDLINRSESRTNGSAPLLGTPSFLPSTPTPQQPFSSIINNRYVKELADAIDYATTESRQQYWMSYLPLRVRRHYFPTRFERMVDFLSESYSDDGTLVIFSVVLVLLYCILKLLRRFDRIADMTVEDAAQYAAGRTVVTYVFDWAAGLLASGTSKKRYAEYMLKQAAAQRQRIASVQLDHTTFIRVVTVSFTIWLDEFEWSGTPLQQGYKTSVLLALQQELFANVSSLREGVACEEAAHSGRRLQAKLDKPTSTANQLKLNSAVCSHYITMLSEHPGMGENSY